MKRKKKFDPKTKIDKGIDALPGEVKILGLTEEEDGTATVSVEVDDEFISFYKAVTGKKRATKKGVAKFISDTIAECVREDNK